MEGEVHRGSIVVTELEDGSGFLHTYKDLTGRVVRLEYRDQEDVLDPSRLVEYREYDAAGRQRVLRFTDAAGDRTPGPVGFATRRTEYLHAAAAGGLVQNDRHYDSAESPMTLPAGYFRSEMLFQGSVLQSIRYFDPADQRVVVSVEGVSDVYEVRFYFLQGASPITVETFFDKSGTPITKRRVSGQTKFTSTNTTYHFYY